jgi:hypothetical protein
VTAVDVLRQAAARLRDAATAREVVFHPPALHAVADVLEATAGTTCDCGQDEPALALANVVLGVDR